MTHISRRRWLHTTAARGAGALLLPGCALQAEQDHAGPDAPDAAPLARPPQVAWVFSSGGPRGFVHVGVVKALHVATGDQVAARRVLVEVEPAP